MVKATIEPAKIIGRVPGLGTLQVGAPAGVAILDLVDGLVEFVDTRNNKRSGTKKLAPRIGGARGTVVRAAPATHTLHLLNQNDLGVLRDLPGVEDRKAR